MGDVVRVRRARVSVVREGRGVRAPDPITNPKQAASVLATLFPQLVDGAVECVVVLGLDARNRPIVASLAAQGTYNAAGIEPSDIFRVLILEGATSCVIVHNHPSGDPTPSKEDMALTERLAKVGHLLGIALLDHVIVGGQGTRRVCSIREEEPELFKV